MKIKNDFITNSSSSSFIFIFNGDEKESLFNLIRKYKENFNHTLDFGFKDHHDIRQSTHHFVIDSIDDLLDKNQIQIQTLESLIEVIDSEIKFYEKKLHFTLDDWYLGILNDYKNKLIICTEAKEKGLTNYVEVAFGDNHGNIRGKEASVLDYLQNEITIFKKDLYILIENQH